MSGKRQRQTNPRVVSNETNEMCQRVRRERNSGGRLSRRRFARFNYAEKAEYWALVWGMFVMAGTGGMLWAKVFVGDLLPRWWLDIATAIHFYEAVLATLAIVVWHFYQVFLDPDTYPMNWAWWDGKMSFEHYREEHALDTETLLDAGRRDAAEPSGDNLDHSDADGNGSKLSEAPPEPVDSPK